MNEVRWTFRLGWQALPSLRADDTGGTAVEYGLIAALIVLAILGGLKTLGASIAAMPMQSIINAIQAVLT